MASIGDHHLPEDVMIDIMSRLPVKSLLRFECVCKHWYSLIQTSTFINNHFHNPSNHAHLLVFHRIHETEKWAFALFPDETLAHDPPAHEDLDYLQMPKSLAFVIGPVNGLLLLNYDDGCDYRLALWNPATREFRRLCLPHPNVPPYFIPSLPHFGFGLDVLTKDYKVVSILHYRDESRHNPFPLVVTLYTLGNDSWTHLEILDPPLLTSIRTLCNPSSTTYLNGAYYWLSGDHKNNYTIILFDMGRDMFRLMEAPHNPESKPGNLMLHNDSLALFLFEYLGGGLLGSMDLWVMKQEGCWTKKFTVGSHLEVQQLLGFWKNDELFLETITKQLVLYNSNTLEVRNLGIQGNEYGVLWLFNYKESLVSLLGGNEEWERANLSDMLQDFFAYNPRTGREGCQYCPICKSYITRCFCAEEEEDQP